MAQVLTTKWSQYNAMNMLNTSSVETNLRIGANSLDHLATICHLRAVHSGWWHDKETGDPKELNIGERICLLHSEASEMMEGFRKDLPSDHIEGFSMAEEEAADILIRLFDMAEPAGLRLGEAFIAKLNYNAVRPDHKPENREKEGGKQF
jgi:hypothetical protein